MPLENFGSILSLAIEWEGEDTAFYTALSENPACAEYKEIFEQFAADGKKNEKNLLRIRRENVTEMILEPIKDFSEEPFRVNLGDPVKLNAIDAIEAARILEEQRESFYTDAAEKIKALSEVSRALKQIAKKRAGHKEKL